MALFIVGSQYLNLWTPQQYADSLSSTSPKLISGLTNIIALTQSVGDQSTYPVGNVCVLDSSGEAKCWGLNRDRQLHSSNYSFQNITTIKANYQTNLSEIVEIISGARGACVLQITGKVKCWGANAYLGRGGGNGSTPYPRTVLSGASGSDWVPGARSSHYICRKNFSRCALSPVSLAPEGEGSNHIITVASPGSQGLWTP